MRRSGTGMIGARALSAVFCLLVAAGSGLQPSPGFAQSTSVAAQAMQWPPADETLTLFLRMDPVDADVLFHKDPYDTSSFAVSIEEDGRLLSGRIEIAAALVRDLPRKSLLLNLAAGDSWHGLRQVSLNAMGTDSTMLREYLTWSLFRVLGMAVPRVQYARVTINNEYIGLFLFVEAVAPEMFDRRGLGGDGALFRPRADGYCGDLTVASLDRAGDCWEKLSPAGTDAWELAALIREIEATPVASFAAFVDRRFDVDSLLNWLAATILTSDNETYNKGYFLYRSRREPARWTVAPWGHDRAYGRVWDPVRAFPADLYNDNFRYSDPPDLGAANPLKDKLFANPELFRRLKLRLGHLLGVGAPEPGAPAAAYGWFSPPRVNERLVALEKRIGDDRRRGLQAEGSDTGQDSGLAALQHYHLARYLYLQNVLLDKTAYGTSRWSPAMSAVARAELAGQPVRPADERWRVPREVRAARELRMEKGGSHVVDADNGMLLATVWLRELAEPATRLAVEAFVEQPPPLAPPGVAAGQCLERTWLVTSQTPGGRLVGDFRFEYLDEHSLHNELGAKVDDEGQLRLWLLDADGLWRPLPTVVDARANTLTTKALPLEPLRLYRLVACQSNAAPAAPGRAQ